MMTFRNFLVPIAVSATVVLAGCGGGDGGGAAPPRPDTVQGVSALAAFMNDLIARTDETSEPIDVDGLTLVTDDASAPSPL